MKNEEMQNVYGEGIPDFLEKYLSTEEMQRISKIDMNCGMKYTCFSFFQTIPWYSRYEHSLGTALITWHFTKDKAMTLASLFHDIATPVFSHVVDFANGDHLKQESTEERTSEILANSKTIPIYLKEDGVLLEQVNDYHQYSICDNESPKVCADRLEYLLNGSYVYGITTQREIQEIYEDILVAKNENEEEELIFQHLDVAVKFANIGLQCGKIYIQREDRYCMERLGILLNQAIKDKILNKEDFYSTEADVIQKLENSPLCNEWHAFQSLNKMYYEKEQKNKEWLSISAKKRYIDPYVKDLGRISELDSNFKEEMEDFKKRDDSKEWLYGIGE